MNNEINIITLGDIFKNIETEEKAFKFKDYIINLQQENKQLKEKIKDTIKDLQENNNGDDYSLINVINILKNLLEE